MIVYTVDRTYLPLACISIASMTEHCPRNLPPVTLLLHDVDTSLRNCASSFLSGLQVDFELIDVEPGWCQPWATQRKQSAAKFGYLKMEKFITRPVDRVVVVDADTRFVDDVNKIFDADLQGKVLGAVDDTAVIATGKLLELQRKLHLNEEAGYLNSGLLVVDMNKWIKQEIGEACVRIFTEKPEILTFNDQCALNAVLSGEYARLPVRWNCLYGSVPAEWPVSMYHFAGSFKPWSMGFLKQVPYVRQLLGQEHIDFYRTATKQLEWHDNVLTGSSILQTWKALRLLHKMGTSGRLQKYRNRQYSEALVQFAISRPHLMI
jgi:lipopolysaccharide biosynthesis glycosyltransferase